MGRRKYGWAQFLGTTILELSRLSPEDTPFDGHQDRRGCLADRFPGMQPWFISQDHGIDSLVKF